MHIVDVSVNITIKAWFDKVLTTERMQAISALARHCVSDLVAHSSAQTAASVYKVQTVQELKPYEGHIDRILHSTCCIGSPSFEASSILTRLRSTSPERQTCMQLRKSTDIWKVVLR
jgi:hypothetical protein